MIYRASPKHCEPITAERPGTKCPAWSVAEAQALLDEAVPMGQARVATRNGLAFVARPTSDGTWHGYPEAWDKVEPAIRQRWLADGRVTRRDLRRWADRPSLRLAWKELP